MRTSGLPELLALAQFQKAILSSWLLSSNGNALPGDLILTKWGRRPAKKFFVTSPQEVILVFRVETSRFVASFAARQGEFAVWDRAWQIP
jgi:hypothetical protein